MSSESGDGDKPIFHKWSHLFVAVGAFAAVAAAAFTGWGLVSPLGGADEVTTSESVPKAARDPESDIDMDEERIHLESSVKPGWGPPRPTYSMTSPAAIPAINSIIDNPNYGDERNFVTCRIVGDNFGDVVPITAPTEVVVQAYLDSATSPNLSEQYVRDITLHTFLPSEPADDPGIKLRFTGTNPMNGEEVHVWDSCQLLGDQPLKVEYLPSSAKVHTNRVGSPHSISDAVVQGRQLIPAPEDGAPEGGFPPHGFYGYFQFTVFVTPV